MAEFLDGHQIEAAVQFVNEQWAEVDRLMLPKERADWADVLAYVHAGELKPVIERWATSTRPSAQAVLDYILTNRTRAVVVAKEPLAPELGGKVTPVVAESIAEARECIRRRLERETVPCAPDPR